MTATGRGSRLGNHIYVFRPCTIYTSFSVRMCVSGRQKQLGSCACGNLKPTINYGSLYEHKFLQTSLISARDPLSKEIEVVSDFNV